MDLEKLQGNISQFLKWWNAGIMACRACEISIMSIFNKVLHNHLPATNSEINEMSLGKKVGYIIFWGSLQLWICSVPELLRRFASFLQKKI